MADAPLTPQTLRTFCRWCTDSYHTPCEPNAEFACPICKMADLWAQALLIGSRVEPEKKGNGHDKAEVSKHEIAGEGLKPAHSQVEKVIAGKRTLVCVSDCYACERAGLQARCEFTKDYEAIKLQLATNSVASTHEFLHLRHRITDLESQLLSTEQDRDRLKAEQADWISGSAEWARQIAKLVGERDEFQRKYLEQRQFADDNRREVWRLQEKLGDKLTSDSKIAYKIEERVRASVHDEAERERILELREGAWPTDPSAQRRRDFEAGWIAGEEWTDDNPAADEITAMDARKAGIAAYLASDPS